jgi:4-alpha-glucanotransferase
MFPFRAFWDGTDVAKRVQVGILPADRASAEREERARLRDLLEALWRERGHLKAAAPSADEALDAGLRHLASSDAELMLVNLEDLWGETSPQNIPGTTHQHPNWSRRIPHDLSTVRMMATVVGRLEEVDRLRRKG